MNIAISCLNVELDKLGGVQNRLRYLIRGILKKDHELNIIQTEKAHQASEEFYNHLDRIPKFILLSNSSNIKYPWVYIKQNSSRIGKKLIDERIDILDTYDPYIHLNNFAKPVIYTTNFFIDYVVELFGIHQFRYSYMHLLKCLVEGRLINRADHFIIQNSIQKRRLMEHHSIPKDRISIIPTGYDKVVVDSIAKKGDSGTYEAQKNLIVYSGRISVYKGVFELVSAFEKLHKEHPSWKLWLVGDGPDKTRLERVVNERRLSKYVTFLGAQTPEDTIKYTNMSEIFVFPSYIESVPGSLLEAMALGKPVVVADVGPIGIDIVDDESGILVPPMNSGSLKKGILKLIDNPSTREKIGSNARIKVSKLTKQNMVKRTLETYAEVVER